MSTIPFLIRVKSLSIQNKINGLALLVFVLTAIGSIGHNQSDEHYQILEFAQYKLGHIQPEELPWEFNEQMRPTLQPWLVVGMVSLFNAINVTDPFVITMLFRLMTAILLWWIFMNFNKVLCKKYFHGDRWAILFSCCAFFIWYVPYNSVRFSSESYSGICLLAGLYLLIKDSQNRRYLIWAGMCLGLALLFKAQVGLAVLGIFCWLFFKEKRNLLQMSYMIAIFFVVILFGVYLDSQFYNELVFTPYNFIKANLEGGRASEFGTAPFYYYLLVFFLATIPPISLVLPAAFFSGAHKLKNSIIIWCIIPFILVHCIIPHKEVRFLLPIQYLIVFVAIYGLSVYFRKREIKKYQRVIFKIAVGLNTLVLLFVMYKPAKGNVLYQKYLYENIEKGNHTVVTTEREYYKTIGDLKTTFYRPKKVKSLFVETEKDLAAFLELKNIAACYYVHRGFSFSGHIPGYTLKKVYALYPEFIEDIPWVNTQKIRTDCIYLVTKD